MGMNLTGSIARGQFLPFYEPAVKGSPQFPISGSALRPLMFRSGCVFCADIVVLRKLYRPYRRHEMASRRLAGAHMFPDFVRARLLKGNVASFFRTGSQRSRPGK
jgi:hypothetical protein